MISLYNIKPKFQQLLLPVLRLLYRMGITANGITWSAVVLSLSVGILFWWKPTGIMMVILPISLLLRMALNALDGMMARTYSMQSKTGEVLNELGDIFADIFMFLPLIRLDFVQEYVVIGFILLSIINECAGILSKAITGIRRYDGPMGKSDRALVIGISLLMIYFLPETSIALNYILISASTLLIISTGIRIKHTIQ